MQVVKLTLSPHIERRAQVRMVNKVLATVRHTAD
jgi:hypothetical protein